MDVLLRGYVLKEKAGLAPDADLRLSQMPVANMNAALDAGVVDAAFEGEPFVSQSVLRGASSSTSKRRCPDIPGTSWPPRHGRSRGVPTTS